MSRSDIKSLCCSICVIIMLCMLMLLKSACVCVLFLPWSLLPEHSLHSSIDDNMCVMKLICLDLCCVHLQVISVIPLHQTLLQGLCYYFLPSLLDWSSCIQKRISHQPVPIEQKASHRALLSVCFYMLECHNILRICNLVLTAYAFFCLLFC